MPPDLPLLHSDADAPLLWRDGVPLSRGRFAAAVLALAERLPPREHMLNLCRTRLGFLTALVASASRGRPCLLPGMEGPTPAALRSGFPDVCVLSEDARLADVTVVIEMPSDAAARLDPIPGDTAAAVVFTSGSTGRPQAHVKTWHALWHAGHQIAERLLPNSPAHLVATVPMHHMYGLETSVILPLVTGHGVGGERPVFPEDVRAALAAVPTPRVLVTTPVHLRALLNASVRLPSLARIISATAPLPADLAARAEAAFDTPVHEIYGCTEAGSIASRRSVAGPHWMPLDGIRVEHVNGRSCVRGPHLDGLVPLHDVLENDNGIGFRLLGREGDMVKVCGKRASLADLTGKLLSIPGVDDGIVFQPDAHNGDTVLRRLAALVVAPHLSEAEILAALGRLVDPVFLPRPLRKIDGLPRNATGKLPRQALHRLLSHA